MTLTFYWEPTLYSILISVLWIFRDTTLILWARTMKKRGTQSKYTNLLLITGIILLTWSSISFFLPDVYLSHFPFPEESEIAMYNTIIFLYIFIPIFLAIFLGVALLLYFYNMYYQHDKKALLGPGIFLLGYVIFIFFMIISFSISVFDNSLFSTTYELYLIGIIITRSIPVVGISFIFFYSIKINNDFLIMFCGLFFAYLTIFLLFSINNTIIYFHYSW